LVELVGGVFDPLLSSAIAVFEHVKDELAVIPCLLLAKASIVADTVVEALAPGSRPL